MTCLVYFAPVDEAVPDVELLELLAVVELDELEADDGEDEPQAVPSMAKVAKLAAVLLRPNFIAYSLSFNLMFEPMVTPYANSRKKAIELF